ncbi:MAG: ABC transporter permease [Spirochaetota bacterium]|nr:ABC transporter permease [Spirochaetota bacterium]
MNQLKESVITLEAGRTERHYWKDLWKYRELFYFLAWRDIIVRYKQTVIGALWAILRPFLTMVIFTVIFGKLAKLPSEGIPYAILVFAGLLPWQLFSNSLSESSNSLLASAGMISKVYFPRLIIPSSTIAVSLVDFLISFVILIGLMMWYQFMPSWKIFTLPLFILLALGASLGVGLWFSSLSVKYRDFRFIVPFVVQLGLFISPVGFSSSIIPEQWKLIYSINPMVGVVDGFRWAILGNDVSLYWPGFILSVALVLLLLISGIWYFRKTEKTFADII